MVPLDKAIDEFLLAVNSNHVSICSGLAAICKFAACSHHPRSPNYCRILALTVAFDIAASPQRVWDCSHTGQSLSFRDRKSDDGLQT